MILRSPAAFFRALSSSSSRAAPAVSSASSGVGVSGGFLTHDTLNKDLVNAQYAVRGQIVLRAQEHARAIAQGAKRPFDAVTYCNIGNPHELGQAPITFFRQVFALVNYPSIASSPEAMRLFPPDAVARARAYIAMLPAGTGAYTNSQGIEGIRAEVAAFISRRDGGVRAHAGDIFLTDGASPAVQMLIRASTRGARDAFMIPIPQYPLYSASLALYGGSQVGYALNEARDWGLDIAELRRAHGAALAAGKCVRGIAVINPGNPTGSCLSEADIAGVLAFAADNRLMVLADEVYQENVWIPSKPFRSFKRVAAAMGLIDADAPTRNAGVQLASFHSTSKGFAGECGRRGGYVELVGFDAAVRAELYKLASISLCANTGGQLMMGLLTNPPVPGDHSYALYARERDDILGSLQRRARKLVAALNGLEGVSCAAPEGALYVFPTITLPTRAVAAAAAADCAPDAFYCLRLLDETGVVVVPGSGFGQAAGTWHFRSTILPAEADLDRVIAAMRAFHARFLAEWK